MTNDEIIDKLIKEQDLISYYIVNFSSPTIIMKDWCADPKISFSKLKEYIVNNENALQSYSVKNLVHIMSSLNVKNDREIFDKLEETLMKKIENEKFYCDEIEVELFAMQVRRPINSFFTNIKPENKDVLRENLINRLNKIEDKEIYEFASTLNTFTRLSGFLELVEKGQLNHEKLDVIKRLAKENENIFSTLNFNMFSDEIYSLGNDFFEKIIKFNNLSNEMLILSKNNPELFAVLADEIKSSDSIDRDSKKIKNMINYFTLKSFEIDATNLDEKSKMDLADWAMMEAKVGTVKVKYSNNYREDFIASCDKKYENTYTLHDKKDLIFNRYLSISIAEAKSLLEQYPEEIKDELFIQIEKILAIETKEELDEVYKNYNAVQLRRTELEDKLSNIATKYTKSYTEVLKETDAKLQKNDAEYIEYEGERIKQIQLTGEFDIFVHSSDAGFVNDVELKNNSFKDTWQKGKDNSNHIISMSYINEDFLGCAPVNNNGVIYGFTNIDSEKIGKMGKTDINTFSRDFGFESKNRNYMQPENMINNSRRVYNEIGVERVNTNPDYIVLFSDASEQIKQNSYKAALEFGIPILIADKELIKNEQLKRIDLLIEDFKETKDIETLGEIFNKYETNMAGWLLNRSELEQDETHTSQIDNSHLESDFKNKFSEIMQVASEYIKSDNKDVGGLLEVMQIFLKENDKYIGTEKVTPISKTHISYEPQEFITQLNDELKKIGKEEYLVDTDKLPTQKEYKIKIDKLAEFALKEVGVSQKDIDDLNKAKANVVERNGGEYER